MTQLAFTAVPQSDRQLPPNGAIAQSLSTMHATAFVPSISFLILASKFTRSHTPGDASTALGSQIGQHFPGTFARNVPEGQRSLSHLIPAQGSEAAQTGQH